MIPLRPLGRTIPHRLAMGAVLAALASAPAGADDMSLAWDHCAGITGASSSKLFACDDDNQQFAIAIGMQPPADMADAIGAQATIDVNLGSSTLPDWWALNGGECRANLLTVGGYSGLVGDATLCGDPWAGGGTGGGGVNITENLGGSANRLRIKAAWAIPTPVAVSGGRNYLAMVLYLSTAHTVSPACAGCSTPACLALDQVTLYGNTNGELETLSQGSNYLIIFNDPGGTSCAVPTRRPTWGTVKALYR